MYNRYIPQPDGTYQRTRMQEKSSQQKPKLPPPTPPYQAPEPPCPPPPEMKPACKQSRPKPNRPPDPPKQHDTSVKGFLQNLLPKDFDTADLLIVLLLLLMSGDCAEDQNTALLTLALYFFM